MMRFSPPPLCVLFTHTHTQTHSSVVNCRPALICCLISIPLFHCGYCVSLSGHFLSLAPCNESVTPPCTHLSSRVAVTAHTHGHLRSTYHHVSVSIRIVCRPSALRPPFVPPPPPPTPPSVSVCLTASHPHVRSHLTTNSIRTHTPPASTPRPSLRFPSSPRRCEAEVTSEV